MHILGEDIDFCGLEATGLYKDLVLKTPILEDVVEVEASVVATTLQHFKQDNGVIDDLQYFDANFE